jgi:MFS family permease
MRLPPRELIVISLAVAATLLGDSLLYAVLPTVWSELGLELWMVGALLSANRFVRFLTNPLAGRIMERIGVRTPFIASVFLAAVTTAGYGLNAGFAVFLVARLCWGLCWSHLRLGGFLSALGSASDSNRGYYLGFYTGVVRIGTLVSVLIGGFLTDFIGFRTTMLLFAVLTFIGALAILREPIAAEAGVGADDESDASEAPRLPGDRRLWAVYAASCINGMAGSQLVVATLGLLLLERFGQTIEFASIAVGVATLTGILLSGRYLIEVVWSPSSGHISDRYDRHWFILLIGIVTVGAMGALSYDASLIWTVFTAGIVFLGGTALRVALDAIAGDLAPERSRARVMSWYSNWSDLGNAIGPFAAYQLVGLVGLGWLYRSSALFLAVAGTISLIYLKNQHSKGDIRA